MLKLESVAYLSFLGMSIQEEGGLNSAGGECGGPWDLVQKSAGCIYTGQLCHPISEVPEEGCCSHYLRYTYLERKS